MVGGTGFRVADFLHHLGRIFKAVVIEQYVTEAPAQVRLMRLADLGQPLLKSLCGRDIKWVRDKSGLVLQEYEPEV